MKCIDDLVPLTIEQLKAIAALAPADENEKKPDTSDKGKPKKSQPGANKKADLGPLNIEKYLNHYGIVFNVKTRDDRTLYRLDKCLFNAAHGKNEAYIQQDSNGTLSYCCSHTSCKHHTWAEARALISGEDSLAPFCAGYDPDWKPSLRSATPSPTPSPPGEDQVKQEFISYNKNGNPVFNVAAMANHLEEHFKPIVFEGVDFGKMFYKYHPASGIWKHFPEAAIRQYVRYQLAEHVTPENISRAVTVFEDQVFKMPEELECDPII